jgi:hypothetical protein
MADSTPGSLLRGTRGCVCRVRVGVLILIRIVAPVGGAYEHPFSGHTIGGRFGRNTASMTALDPSPTQYRIRIRGHLDPTRTVWFDDLILAQSDDGTTELVGPLSDQSALYGLLARLRDLGATLLLVEQLPVRGRTGNGSDESFD